MKFVYEYRTSDNAKHNGVVCASDREAAYAALRKRGIKPSRFAEAPGFFNKFFGKGKRWIVIGVLGVLCLLLGVLALVFQKRNAALSSSLVTLNSSFDVGTRRQPIGDQAVIEKGIATGWAEVFDLEGERFLASFAIPGVPPAVRSTTEDEIRKALDHDCRVDSLPDASFESGSIESRQVRAMVEGMKNELRAFMSAGGSIRQYGRRLIQRQSEEISYFTRAQNEVNRVAESDATHERLLGEWERVNDRLRHMGIGPVPLPKSSKR